MLIDTRPCSPVGYQHVSRAGNFATVSDDTKAISRRPVLNGFEASQSASSRLYQLGTPADCTPGPCLAGVRIRELERLEGRPACTIVAVTALSKPEDVKRGIDE